MSSHDAWPGLAFLAEEAVPYTLKAPALLGDAAIWSRIIQGEPTLALLSSTKAPAGVLLAVHDLARLWRRHGPIIISGFHAPVEDEALSVLLRGDWPLVLVLARGLYRRPPGSKTEQLAQEVVEWGKPVYTLDHPANGSLLALGAEPLSPA